MKTLIIFEHLVKQTDVYIDFLSNDLFYEGHEALEELWFPLRFEKDDEVRLIRAYINAAVSFELVKRGREKSGLKPWGFYHKNKHLLANVPANHLPYYEKIVAHILQTQNRLACFKDAITS